jgi:hypothetical protein
MNDNPDYLYNRTPPPTVENVMVKLSIHGPMTFNQMLDEFEKAGMLDCGRIWRAVARGMQSQAIRYDHETRRYHRND